MDVDAESRERRAVWLPPECWEWLEAESAKGGLQRSDLLEGLVLLAMDNNSTVTRTTTFTINQVP